MICPNLIPQTGPTGGGDGKTDTETYSVSDDISNRWYIPNHGWDNNQKWAFAISAKKAWRPKVISDIKKILNTNRGYTKIYFITNQTPSSKQKSDIQDKFLRENSIQVVILDGKWIVEKVFSTNLINFTVESLNLSVIYLEELLLGPRDIINKKELNELEEKISNTNNYSTNDFRLVEDCIRSATLSRNLEKSKVEVEGKFYRAEKFCLKVNNIQQIIRLYYQTAWTFVNYFDDIAQFYQEFKKMVNLIKKQPNIQNIELYFNLLNIMVGINVNYPENKLFNLKSEQKSFIKLLKSIAEDKKRPSLSLLAQSFIAIIGINNSMINTESPNTNLQKINNYLLEAHILLDFPVEILVKIVKLWSDYIPDNLVFDSLIDTCAEIESNRNSEMSSANIYFERGISKFKAELYNDSVVYFGKTLRKISKEESQEMLVLASKALGVSYRNLGLI